MGYTLELLYDLILKPRQTFERIKENAKLSHAAIIMLLCNFLNSTAVVAEDISDEMKISAIILSALGILIGWAINGGIMHAMAHLVGGDGSYKNILKLTAFASFISLLLMPCYLVKLVAPELGMGLFGIVCIILFFWSIYLTVLAISVTYQLSLLRSFFAFVLPAILAASAIIIIAILLFTSFGDFSDELDIPLQMLETPVRL